MERLYNNLPLYEAKITSEDEGLFTLSLVTYPAVESNFYCFNEDRKPLLFKVDNEEEKIISGVVMLANTPIYRRNGDYEYYITYSRDTIKTMATKMLEEGTFKNISLQHNGKLIDGVSMVELYIKDSSKGLNPNYVDDIPDGSLMASYKVDDDELWDEIKNNDILNGFSLEGLFDVQPVQMNKINKKDNKLIMKTLDKIVKFVKSLVKYGSAETDKATLYWEGDGELEVDTEVFVENEEGIKDAAPDGDYIYGEKIIVVSDGKVSLIKDKEDEEEEETSVEEEIAENAAFAKFNKVKQIYEESYEEKERQIIDAIVAKGYEAYIIEAGDDFAVAEVWDEEEGGYKDFRFPISWGEDGEVIVGEPEEVKPAFVPVDTDVEEVAEDEEKKEEEEFAEEEAEEEAPAEEAAEEAAEIVENDYEDRIKALEDAIKALEDRIAALESAPASESVEEEFEAVNRKQVVKGNKAAKLLSHLND